MNSTTLTDNLTSDYLAAMSKLQPKLAPQKVLVYVEDNDDISFWRSVLGPFERGKLKFDVQLPVRDEIRKGKTEVLKMAEHVGTNLILCIDSDYDYLLQTTTETSTEINKNPYIFQTYTYSIENFLCYADSLHAVCTSSSKNDESIVDFKELMKLYSEIIYPLFLWSVHFSLRQDSTSFTISNFCEVIKIKGAANLTDKFSGDLLDLKSRVEVKLNELETHYSEDVQHVEALKARLQDLGVEKTNTYLFIQGHTLLDNVVTIFLREVVDELSSKKRLEIS